MKDFFWPILILIGIISIALSGAGKNNGFVSSQNNQNTVPPPSERQLSQDEIAWQLQNSQYQAQQLQQKVAVEQEAKVASVYKNQITMYWGSWSSTDPDQEYIEIDANYGNTTPINITGWTLMSTSTGITVTIPQSTGLYQSNSTNNTWTNTAINSMLSKTPEVGVNATASISGNTITVKTKTKFLYNG